MQKYIFRKGLVVGIITMFLLTSSTTLSDIVIKSSNSRGDFTPHNPIYIDGNDDFIPRNGVVGGSGTKDEPYIIEGWSITPSLDKHGITILNTNVYFVIKNCCIYGGGNNNDGIVFGNVENGVIEKNIISGNRNGICFTEEERENSYNIISNNSIIFNFHSGISFQHTLYLHRYNIITHNYIADNGGHGIDMIMSRFNQITYNNITSNGYSGILVEICIGGGEYNIFHHNNFIYNTGSQAGNQAFEFSGQVNYWDDSYPSGGNYWCDYTGEDYFSGSNQDILGSDGIGDIPYEIPSDFPPEANWDRYPLIAPCHLYENIPPTTPIIKGPTNGKPLKKYDYTFNSIDLDGDGLYYYIDWGDGKNSSWLGPHVSDWEITVNHLWLVKGDFIIKAKAKDIYGAESSWGTLTVTMPRNKQYSITPFQWFLQQYPNLFPIIRLLLQRLLGLQ